MCQVLSPEATLVFEVQGGKKASREGEEEGEEGEEGEGEDETTPEHLCLH